MNPIETFIKSFAIGYAASYLATSVVTDVQRKKAATNDYAAVTPRASGHKDRKGYIDADGMLVLHS